MDLDVSQQNYIKQRSLLISLFIFMGVLLPALFVYAEATSQAVLDRRAELEQELIKIEKELEPLSVILQEKQRETVSLDRDITILDTKIRSANLSIRSRNIVIGGLKSDIGSKSQTIEELGEKLLREKESLAQLLRKTRELDSYSIVEVILGTRNLSDFFQDIDSFGFIKAALGDSFKEIAKTKKLTAREKSSLQEKQREEEELRKIQELQKRRIVENKSEKRQILAITKGEEDKYQEIIKAKKKSATAIRSELFSLRGSAAIPFEKALLYANRVFKKTGVRPALILGVIAQESNLGENVGQCLLTNSPKKGDGKGVNTGRLFSGVMKASRDVDIFIHITENLGINFNTQVVSCPPSYGYGGAMGPAQFIPSTWILFEKKISRLTGNNPPNPWDPVDAFMASGLLLKDNGAARGGYSAERLAALRYFAGWGNAKKKAYAFYGDDVMVLTAKYQKQIDILQGG